MRSALLEAAAVGPFFQLEVHDHGLPPGWQPARELFENDLNELAARNAERLGTDEIRVSTSILHLSFAARIWSPVLGCASLAGAVPDLASLVVTTEPSIRLGLTDLVARRPDTNGDSRAAAQAGLAELAAAVTGAPLAELASALPVRLARGLLRGNSASAMAGALGELVRVRPDLGESAAALGAALLRTPGLAGAGRLTRSGLAFRRHSCCLYYRVPGGGLCGDCCFDHSPSARR
jgi:FhuF 2Fe-2S C-terminal domain